MAALKFAAFLMILGSCYGYHMNNGFNTVNSLTNFIDKVRQFLQQEDNGLSEQCNNHMEEYINGLGNNTIWALKMFDASSKIPSGIADGNFVDLGFFDECLAVEGISISTVPVEKVYGKYCIGTLPLQSPSKTQNKLSVIPQINDDYLRVATPDRKKGLQFAICIPNSCSAAELAEIYTEIGFNISFYEDLCQTKADQPKLDSGGKATLWFLGIVMWIILICTAYDAFIYYMEKKPAHQILTAFSVLTNGKKLLITSNSPNQISCLHGIRVISTMWVILGHRYFFHGSLPVRNYLYSAEWMEERSSLFIINADLSVDSFFLMSGLVVTYMHMTAASKGVNFNIILFYVHRYLRLTPVLAVIVLIHITLIQHFGSGPVYLNAVQPQLVTGCEKYWWKSLLYIQNYGGQTAYCIPQSWYLSVDTQLFVIAPIILIPLTKWPKPALISTGILTLCSMLVSFLTGWFFELNMNTVGNTGKDSANFMIYYYCATQTRAGTWLIGIVLGYFIFQVKQRRVRLMVKKELILVAWAISLAVLCTGVFTGHNLIFGEDNRIANSIRMALVRPAWAVALGWIIFACVIGYGGPVNWFLSLPVFQILSKFTYTLYLLHLQVILIAAAQMRSPSVFSNERILYGFWSDFVFTLALAIVFTLAFESPLVAIEQLLFGKSKKKKIQAIEPEDVKHIEKPTEIA